TNMGGRLRIAFGSSVKWWTRCASCGRKDIRCSSASPRRIGWTEAGPLRIRSLWQKLCRPVAWTWLIAHRAETLREREFLSVLVIRLNSPSGYAEKLACLVVQSG